MRLRNTLRSCVVFARFAEENNFDPKDLAELLTLAQAAFRAGTREITTGRSAESARRRFEAKAKALGYGTFWEGFWPELLAEGRGIPLPEV